MDFVIIPDDRFDDVIRHLRHTFFADEPLNKSVQLCRPGDGHVELERHSLATLHDGFSVMAVTQDNRIAGVVLNGVLRPGDIESSLAALADNKDASFKKIFKLLYTQNLQLDLFRRYAVDRIFEIRILSVDAEFRGQGLAKELLKRSERVAIDNGFTMLKTDATGMFSQRSVQSLGFQTIAEVRYDAYTEANGEPSFTVELPHQCLKIMQKQVGQ